MTRLWLRVGGRVLLALLGLVALSQTQRVRPHPLAELLLPPPGCDAPCWLGVRPGQTSLAETLQLMEGQPWVDHMNVWQQRTQYGLHFPAREGWTAGTLRVSEGIVTSVLMQTTRIPLGDIWAALGPPAQLVVYDDGSPASRPLVAVYPQYGLFLYIGLNICEVDQNRLWREPGLWIAVIYPERLPDFPRLGVPELERIEMLNLRYINTARWAWELRQRRRCG